MMGWLSRNRPVVAAAVVVLATNVWLLGAAASNRSGASPIFSLDLTERELQLPLGSTEDTGLELEFVVGNIWRESYVAGYYLWQQLRVRAIEDMLLIDRDRMQEIGFDVSADLRPWESYSRQLPREVFVVLEADGPAWQSWVQSLDSRLEDLRRDARDGELTASDLEVLVREVEFQRVMGSRLIAIDAGHDAEALTRRYPGPGIAIVRGVIAIAKERPGEKWVLEGQLHRLLVSSVHVPANMRRPVEGLERPARFARLGDPNRLDAPQPPRYRATVAFGRRHEPYLVDLRPADAPGPR